MSKIKDNQARLPVPLPAFVYSFVFVLFFLLGLILTQPFEMGNFTKEKDPTLVQILVEGQNLNHFHAQNTTINWLHKGDSNEK